MVQAPIAAATRSWRSMRSYSTLSLTADPNLLGRLVVRGQRGGRWMLSLRIEVLISKTHTGKTRKLQLI